MLEFVHIREEKEIFLREIKGSQVVIPDLYALLPSWRFNMNPNYHAVKTKTDAWLESWLQNDILLRRMKMANFSRLAACLYPDASEEECLMMSYYHLWVFLWDDELDCGPYANDPRMALQFKKETDRVLDYTLGDHPFTGHPPPMTPIMAAFSTVAEKVVAGTTAEIRRRFLSELKYYVDSACLLPLRRNTAKQDLLSVEGFLEQRKASGGCGPSIVLTQYVYRLDIPAFVLDHESMRVIWDQACMLGHLINDLVSFAKELADNQLDNIVPVLAMENKISLQEAIEIACDLVCKAHQTFEDAEKRVPMTGNPKLDKKIRLYIQACKDLVTGELNWCCQNERYFGKNPQREGNKVFLKIAS